MSTTQLIIVCAGAFIAAINLIYQHLTVQHKLEKVTAERDNLIEACASKDKKMAQMAKTIERYERSK